jgi:hypothetical protein
MILEAKSSAIGRGAEGAAGGPGVVFERATGEEAVPEKLTVRSRGSVDAGRFEERTETVSEIDPNYGELAMRAAEIELELRELVSDDWGPVAALTAELEEQSAPRSSERGGASWTRSLARRGARSRVFNAASPSSKDWRQGW